MTANNQVYIDRYMEYVQSSIDKYFKIAPDLESLEKMDSYYTEFAEQLVKFSLDINKKANDLLNQASLSQVNTAQLQKELFNIGKEYIQQFTFRHKQKRNDG
jgi:GTP1/Obg family GTP-binding protein